MIMDTTLQLAHPCSFYHSGLSSRPPFMAASGRLAHAQVWVLLESIFHQSFVTTFCSCRSALDRAKIYHLTSQRQCFPFQKNLSSCYVLHDSFKPSMLAWLHILPMERLSSLKLTSARHRSHSDAGICRSSPYQSRLGIIFFAIHINISTTTLSAGISAPQ